MATTYMDLTESVKLIIKDQIAGIVEDETKKAMENVEKRINQLIPDVTFSVMERVEYEVSEKEISFKIKPKVL